MMESGKEELDVLRELGLKEKPLSGKENHALLEKNVDDGENDNFLRFPSLV